MKSLMTLVMAIMLGSCVMPPKLQQPVQRTQDFKRDYDAVWREAVRMIAREGYIVTATDKSSGLISYAIKFDGDKVSSYAAETPMASYQRGAATIQVLIESQPVNLTKVTVLSRLNGTYHDFWTGQERTLDLNSNGELEKEFFKKLSTAVGETKFEFLEK